MTAPPRASRRSISPSAIAALLAACSIDHGALQAISTDGAAAVGMTTVQTNDAGVSLDGSRGGPFRVQLTSDAPQGHICSGACALLSARAEQGVSPYHYRFDQGPSESAETKRVCPTETTTYQVSVEDSSFDGEFGGKNAPVSGSLTVTVDSCVDGTLPIADDAGANDAGIATPMEPTVRDAGVGPSGAIACQHAIATAVRSGSSDGWFEAGNFSFKHTLVSSVDGDAFFVARYNGTVTLSDGTSYRTNWPAANALLVGKLAPDCRLLWSKNLTGVGSAAVGRLATDSAGRLIVMSQTQRRDHEEAWNLALTVLAPDGALVWEKVLGAVTGGVGTLRTDANDDIVMAFGAIAGEDFGGGALGKQASTANDMVVVLGKYSSAGVHLWSKLVQEELAVPTLAISGKTTILLHARSSKALDWGAAGHTRGTQASGAHGYLVAVDRDGNYLWSRVAGDVGDPPLAVEQLDVNAAGQLVMSQFPVAGELTVGSVDGTSTNWKAQVLSPSAPSPGVWNKTHCDAFGNTFVGGMFAGELTLNGVSLRAASGSAYVQKIGPDGNARWTYLPRMTDSSAPAELLGLGSDGQGGALMLTTPQDRYQHEIHVIRLFP